jgi:hypothetical protein
MEDEIIGHENRHFPHHDNMDDEAAGAFKIGNARYNFNFWGDEHEDVYDEEAGRRWPGRPGPMPGQGPRNPNPPPGQFRL